MGVTAPQKFLVAALNSPANERLMALAKAAGWRAAALPCLQFVDLPLPPALPAAEWLALTSPRGAARFILALENKEISPFEGKIAAVGEATAEVLRPMLQVDFLPSVANARTLAAEIPALRGEKIIAFGTPDAGPDLRLGLERRGLRWIAVHGYRGRPRELSEAEKALLRRADAVAVGSGLVAAELCRTVEDTLPLVCMGRQTAEAAKRAGGRRVHVAEEPTLASTLAACEALIFPF